MARTAKTDKAEAAVNPTHVLAKVENRHYDSQGKRLSPPPFTQYYTPLEWEQFRQMGPKLGIFLVEVLEAPEGTDTSYDLMSPGA